MSASSRVQTKLDMSNLLKPKLWGLKIKHPKLKPKLLPNTEASANYRSFGNLFAQLPKSPKTWCAHALLVLIEHLKLSTNMLENGATTEKGYNFAI